ncbi:MAG: hypothetical protein EP329_27665 [Deltaproteobacteria bacterium]|nr:MAG: hypothetical protein EP329_27665 [Deltaproteobacteria bacterium]
MKLVRRFRLLTAIAALFVIGLGTQASAKEVTPEKGTVYEVLYSGLKAVADGKFDVFVDRYCSKDKLCPTDQAIRSLKKYNLPAAQRQAPKCLKGDKLDVTRVDGDLDKDEMVKIFLVCDPNGMPRPYQMTKEGGKWMFKNIY